MATDKYDRQLRLWGYHGQKLLRESNICLLGSSAPGIEALKGLVLPACGHVVIWDDAITTTADLGCNFFLTPESIGKPRAQQSLNLLLELNPDVKGEAVVKPPAQILTSEHFKSFTIIISNQQNEHINIGLSKLCEGANKPAIFINTYGYFGYIRNQISVHEVYENKELKKPDLRLSEPFDTLKEFASEFEVEKWLQDQTVENIDKLVHVPYNAIIINAVKATGGTNLNTIKNKIKEWKAKVNAEDLQNFDEALKNAYRINNKKQDVLDGINMVLENQCVDKATQAGSPYWIFCKVLKNYIAKYGDYPQIKQIPDMKSTTKSYIILKQLYLKQHNRTKELFLALLSQLFPNYKPNLDLVTTFIENLTNMEVVQMRPFWKELEQPQPFSFENNYPMIYVALRGAALYKSKHGKCPTRKDVQQLSRCIQEVRKTRYPDMVPIEKNIIEEVARVQGSEMISVSAITGNIVSQEAIKLITHQFTPLTTGYFYDGIQCIGTTIEL